MILAALALASQAAPPPAGGPAQWPIVSRGWGTCEDWTGERRSSNRAAKKMEQWVFGYLTAAERYGRLPRNLRAHRDNPVWSQLDSYCAANPTATFQDAVGKLVGELRRASARGR